MQVLWVLLTDLLASPEARARCIAPPLAAAVDVWPALIQPPPGGGNSRLATLHAALQHVCTAAAAADDQAAPELEHQPAVAAAFLRQLGCQRWGWAADAAGSDAALRDVRAALAGPGGDVVEEEI